MQVSGQGGVPASVEAVVLNVTVIGPVSAGYLSVSPEDPNDGFRFPKTSSVNYAAGGVQEIV